MRCEVIEIRGATIINDTYNSNPTAMRAALELLRDFDAAGRRIVICGDMAELGPQSIALHWQMGKDIVPSAARNWSSPAGSSRGTSRPAPDPPAWCGRDGALRYGR